MTIIKFIDSDTPSRLTDAEVHFIDGPLAGLKLNGFSIYRMGNGDEVVSFPDSLHSIAQGEAANQLRQRILRAFHLCEAEIEVL